MLGKNSIIYKNSEKMLMNNYLIIHNNKVIQAIDKLQYSSINAEKFYIYIA